MLKNDPLAELLEDGVIDAVHTRLMSGKEATVFVVERRGHLGAAKVYRSRQDRTFKKVVSYTEGRNQTRNSRDRRAIAKRSGYGRELMEESWQDMEFRALRKAYEAGVLVPEPFFVFPNVLLMELVVDNRGAPASRLADFPYTPEQANALHLEVFMQVKQLLGVGLIHGDLSAYNVLMSARGATLIDLPQVVDVAGNSNASQILRRDLENITEHLARYDARLQRFSGCGEALFGHYARGTLDLVTGPEESAPHWRTGGRRGRDAERGRAGRQKGGQSMAASPPPHGDPPGRSNTERARASGPAPTGRPRANDSHPRGAKRDVSSNGPRPQGLRQPPSTQRPSPAHDRTGRAGRGEQRQPEPLPQAPRAQVEPSQQRSQRSRRRRPTGP